MDILAVIIKEHPLIYEEYLENKKYVEQAFPIRFFEMVMDYEEDIKQRFSK